eukprot:scaffold15753_cov58-Phaeocystis_antarctica.AAC.3
MMRGARPRLRGDAVYAGGRAAEVRPHRAGGSQSCALCRSRCEQTSAATTSLAARSMPGEGRGELWCQGRQIRNRVRAGLAKGG